MANRGDSQNSYLLTQPSEERSPSLPQQLSTAPIPHPRLTKA
ncbi:MULTISPECIES: hypothetical protein [Kamptonema]|nr:MULTISPECIES: hypothetical protein [Kamptonema]